MLSIIIILTNKSKSFYVISNLQLRDFSHDYVLFLNVSPPNGLLTSLLLIMNVNNDSYCLIVQIIGYL